ncbi:hypothetical protein IRR91_001096 [Salmonella enterica]|uniref:Uncharacterized protein n=1 Tax=Salmonella enterica subsp. arizonae serovar 48:z4,z24:- TaxID=1967584 RepID=A0A738X7S3_SALER|nr:hypothetical protein [Salmonella enterica]EAN8609715.1 hypothetical protein [Salmonella enterica subsp. arizonae serovar 48:z4,z24:-]EAO5936779.1 hypothetical protein [Salmonella enterica subsp. houtenae serovar 48:g,z51:-]EBP3771075.1 hypothetical protein [Salmonella enterica subsp. arizonae]EBP3817588.1 hypothetical protein [Salmonella enterica subsp. enterica]ECP3266172.1 hypothetical protein [Salmonella enterica subsp. enterica serovar [1],13,23:g,z51:-]
MMLFSIISAVNGGVLSSACTHFLLDESKLVEPGIIGDNKERTLHFDVLLNELTLYPYETADPLFISINAVTSCCGESSAYQLAISTGRFPLYESEINELMKDFLYQHVVDANGHVKITFTDVCKRLNSLWRKFTEENLRTTSKDEEVVCSSYTMPVSVPEKESSLDEKDEKVVCSSYTMSVSVPEKESSLDEKDEKVVCSSYTMSVSVPEKESSLDEKDEMGLCSPYTMSVSVPEKESSLDEKDEMGLCSPYTMSASVPEKESSLDEKDEMGLCSPYTMSASVPEKESSLDEKDEKVVCSSYTMSVSVPGKESFFDQNKLTLKDVKNFKKIQSAFKRELSSIQKSLNVLNNRKAVERFREYKTVELFLQTGVHTGFCVAGGLSSAVIGTAISPGFGTLIGAGVGAGLAWSGKKLYDYAAGAVSNKINPNPHLKTREIDRKIKSAEKGFFWECGAKIKSLVVEPSRGTGILAASLISSVIQEVSIPIHDIATACYDYEIACEGLTSKKASKIEALLAKYHSKLNKEYKQVLKYLEENPTPDNQRRKKKILRRDAVIRERLATIRESIKDAVESRRLSIHKGRSVMAPDDENRANEAI